MRVRGAPTGRGAAKRVAVTYYGGMGLAVAIDGRPPLVDIPRLFARVAVDDSTWTLDGDCVVVTACKADARAWAALALPGSGVPSSAGIYV